MYLSWLLIDTGENPDRPRPGRRQWLRNAYRVHQRLCMGFPSSPRQQLDAEFMKPFKSEDFGNGHVHVSRAADAGFLFRVDPQPRGRAVILVQSAIRPDWKYAFKNAQHLLAAGPQVRDWAPAFEARDALRFRLRANTVRRMKSDTPNKDGPRVPVPATYERLREWLAHRAERAGFELINLSTTAPGYVYANRERQREAGVRLRSVLYEGVLRVTDADAFRGSIESGIGPAKAFGFGLLSIAPLR